MKKFIESKIKILLESFGKKEDILMKEVMSSIDETEIPSDVLDSFKIKDSLNKDLWDGDKLNPKVKFKLIEIAKDFFKDLELPSSVKIKDIIFTGSLANFNWSEYSDIDLHLVVDFSELDNDETLIQNYFNAEKNLWNNNHEIKIHNYPIEIYVQDINAELQATAIFSIVKNKWLKKPTKENFTLDKEELKRKAKKFVDQLNDIKKTYNTGDKEKAITKIDKMWDRLKAMRKEGLDTEEGEFSLENILYKVFRRTSFMDELEEIQTNAYDEMMSLNEDFKGTEYKTTNTSKTPDKHKATETDLHRTIFKVTKAFNEYGDDPYFNDPSAGEGIYSVMWHTNGELTVTQPLTGRKFNDSTDIGVPRTTQNGNKYVLVKAFRHRAEPSSDGEESIKAKTSSPANDAAIKVRILFGKELINFVRIHMDGEDEYTIDDKAPELSAKNMTDKAARLKARKDMEKDKFTRKSELSTDDDKKAEIEKRQAELQAKYAKIKSRLRESFYK